MPKVSDLAVAAPLSATDILYIVQSAASFQMAISDFESALDHGALAGLVDDDHTQYPLLLGRSGGQTLIGGLDAGDDLILQTSSNISKGSYFLSDLTDNGFIVTSGSTGELSIDTNTYLTTAPVEFADNTFRIYDDVDSSKELALQLSGLMTSTTRTLTIPDEDGTIITNATTLAGDVTGTTGATVVADDSHAHTNSTITLASTDLTDTTNLIYDSDFAAAGIMARTAANTYAGRTLTGTSNQIMIADGDGVAGNPTFTLPQNIHTGASPQFVGLNLSGLTVSELIASDVSGNLQSLGVATYPSLTEITYVKGVTSAIQTQIDGKQTLDATLTALAAYNTNGILTQTASDTFTGRTLTGTVNRLSISDGDGVLGNPIFDIDAAYVGQSTITTVGTIGTGVWNGTAITDSYISSASTWNAKQDALTFGIADTNTVVIDHISAADNDYAKFTLNGLEGRSFSEVKIDLSLDSVENTALSTWAGSSNLTTLGTITTGTWQGTTLAVNQGGTGQTSYTNGQLLIGNTTGNTLAKATLTEGEGIDITNGAGTITLSGEDASTSNKGISSFNSTNFSVASGAVNTIQNIATSSSPTFAALTLTGDLTVDTNSLYVDASDNFVGLGTTNPKHRLHVFNGATASSWTNTATDDRGILISDSNGPRLVFEDTGEGADDKVMMLRYEDENLTIDSINDAGTTFNEQNLLVIKRDGKVGIQIDPTNRLHIDCDAKFDDGIRIEGSARPHIEFEKNNTSAKWSIVAGVGDNLHFKDDDGATDGTDADAILTLDTARVGINNQFPNSNAALDIVSTTGALLIPRMTTTQRNALTASNGMILYNTTDNAFNFYENGSWVTK